jgi:hypothetical protein
MGLRPTIGMKFAIFDGVTPTSYDCALGCGGLPCLSHPRRRGQRKEREVHHDSSYLGRWPSWAICLNRSKISSICQRNRYD